jgi:hypothetical protein
MIIRQGLTDHIPALLGWFLYPHFILVLRPRRHSPPLHSLVQNPSLQFLRDRRRFPRHRHLLAKTPLQILCPVQKRKLAQRLKKSNLAKPNRMAMSGRGDCRPHLRREKVGDLDDETVL